MRREQEKAAKLTAKEVQKQEKQKEKVENRASKGTSIHMADWLRKAAGYAVPAVIDSETVARYMQEAATAVMCNKWNKHVNSYAPRPP